MMLLFSFLLAASPPVPDPCKTSLTVDGSMDAPKLAGKLTEVDATRLTEGEVATVGTVKDESLVGVELAKALLTSNTVLTWIHIGSELCLTEIEGGVHVKGTHTYFTNEENVVPIEFEIRVDEARVITVVGK